MQVYVELALLENFCMDFTLLYCARLATRNRARFWRIALASCAGAAIAVAFPLLPLNTVWATVVKLASGFLIALIACNFSSVRAYLKFSFAFVGFTFLLGGALTAIFSLAGVKSEAGAGFVLSSVPIGIPMFGALCLILLAKYLKKRLKKTEKNLVKCRIYAGQSEIELPAFFDSGNCVSYRGQPVSVIPDTAAEKLQAMGRIKDEVKIHTVAGSRYLKVFTAEKVIIYSGNSQKTLRNVTLGISAAKIDRAILHPDLLEE